MTKNVFSYLLIAALYLGIFKGQIALLECDRRTPVTVYPYTISILTEKDKLLLREGIEIKTKSELTKHLDDFIS